jgi:tetratricopeptide (TPR) repeat protein
MKRGKTFLVGIMMCATISGAAAQTDSFTQKVNEATKYYGAGDYAQAEAGYKAAWAMIEKKEDALSLLNKTMILSNLGTIYMAQKKYADAESSYKRSLDLQEMLLKEHHSMTAQTMKSYASLMRKTNRADEAEKLEGKADLLVKGPNSASFSAPVVPPALTAGDGGSASGRAATGSADTKTNKTYNRIDRIVRVTDSDKSQLQNPTTTQKPVYKTEEYTETGVTPQGFPISVKKTREVLDHYETVNLSDESNLSYVQQINDLSTRYRLSDTVKKDAVASLTRGGSLFETENGWLFQTNDDLNTRIWNTGQRISLTPRYESGASVYVITAEDGQHEFVANRIAVK